MTRINWSTLKYLAVSPLLMRWRVDHPLPDSPALRLGRAIHCKVLEPLKFDSNWIIAGSCAASTKKGEPCTKVGSIHHQGKWFCRTAGHAPQLTDGLPDGVECITGDERDLVLACAASVERHSVAASTLKGGKAEGEIEWQDPKTGILCRGRLDYLRPDFVTDLKSTRAETSAEFFSDAARNLYHGQLAWYHDGAIAAGRLPKDADLPRVVSVSTAEPHDVGVYMLPYDVLEAGRIVYRSLLRRYEECLAADWWPGHTPDLSYLELPKWAEGMQAARETTEAW